MLSPLRITCPIFCFFSPFSSSVALLSARFMCWSNACSFPLTSFPSFRCTRICLSIAWSRKSNGLSAILITFVFVCSFSFICSGYLLNIDLILSIIPFFLSSVYVFPVIFCVSSFIFSVNWLSGRCVMTGSSSFIAFLTSGSSSIFVSI